MYFLLVEFSIYICESKKMYCHIFYTVGATENAGVENAEISKMREWKSWHQKAGVENAGETSMESQNSRYLTLLSSRALD